MHVGMIGVSQTDLEWHWQKKTHVSKILDMPFGFKLDIQDTDDFFLKKINKK